MKPFTRLCGFLAFLPLVVPFDAVSCTISKFATDEELFQRASTVFVAHVVRIKAGPAHPPLRESPGPPVVAEFRLLEVLKGKRPRNNRVMDLQGDFCNMPLVAGMDYIFFLRPETKNLVLGPNGSSLLINAKSDESIAHLAKLRRLRAGVR